MQRGFDLNGQQVPFANRARGIWKPAVLGREGVVLSITTATVPRSGTPRYDDQIASTESSFRYRYQDAGPEVADNRAVRRALFAEPPVPIIYFYGIAPSVYRAIAPVFVVGDDRARHAFEIAVGSAALGIETAVGPPETEIMKRYASVIVKRRLHQDRFREAVVHAYRNRCTVCRLGHRELIDAAHILEDRDELGRPEVPNGLALCKIHHSAYDANILGIAPDTKVYIRKDILEEIDGPMLKHGLQEMDGREISVPERAALRPNKEYLEARFAKFRAA